MVAEEVYLRTNGRQRPWVNENLTRLLYFGKTPLEPSGDEGDILKERRQLLLTIADLPDAARTQVEATAASRNVPMDAVYGMAIHNAGAAVIARLADLATGNEASPLFGAGNEGVVARGGRLYRRDDENRSESYAEILTRAGLTEIEGQGKGAPDAASQETYAKHAHGFSPAPHRCKPQISRQQRRICDC